MRDGVVDCHVHVGLTKYRPLEDYLPDMREHGVVGAVLVQHLGNPDNDYLGECRTRGSFAAVGLVEDSTEGDRLLTEGFRGLRLSPVGLESEPGSDRIWEVLADHGAVASVTGPFDAVVSDEFAETVRRFPAVTFRLEHLGWFRYADDAEPPYPLFSRFLRLADLPNTMTTWSGFFVNSDEPYPYPDATPYLQLTLEAFGADRIMWSGDWNRAGLEPDDYPRAIAHIAGLPFLDDDQRRAVLGGTAARCFGLSLPADEPADRGVSSHAG